MIPSAVSAQLEQGLADYLRFSFASTTPGFDSAVDRLVEEPGALLRGPYVSLGLPFVRSAGPEAFPSVGLNFTPHAHQQRAFERLGGPLKQSTLIATGTGSGKTESFLAPILDHCQSAQGDGGIKAILIYPMNALATDQAGRIARWIHRVEKLRGIRAGLFVGRGQAKGRRKGVDPTLHQTMGPDHVITDHETLRLSPPDLLLTNYKMLDFLLLRPGDRDLWAGSTEGSLRFLVVDELHTFDGAQGTDLACLIRRLKRRLRVQPGQLCYVGTSATLGGGPASDPASTQGLRDYAQDVFGEPFPPDSVIGETRQTPEQFLAQQDPAQTPRQPRWPEPSEVEQLDPCDEEDKLAYLDRQARLWFSEPLPEPVGSPEWCVALAASLRPHPSLLSLLSRLEGRPRALDELALEVDELDGRRDPRFAQRALTSLLALVSAARVPREERPATRQAREQRGEPAPLDPLLQVRLQLWVRELARVVGSFEDLPRLRFFDDLTPAQRKRHLPTVHCRHCGAMGWATVVERDNAHAFYAEVSTIYSGYFGKNPRVQFLYPVRGDCGDDGPSWTQEIRRRRIHRETLCAVADEDEETPEELWVEVLLPECTRSTSKGRQLVRDCPFCSASDSLAIVGFRAASLTSVFIDQLFASPYNADKKLLTFSDSVQDAAHRAGFFGSRTWRFSLRAALQRFLHHPEGGGAEDGSDDPLPLTLAQLPAKFSAWWRGAGGLDDVGYVTRFLAPSMEWLAHYQHMREQGSLPSSSDLPTLVDRRLAWEFAVDYGLQSRIGRSLPRTRASILCVDPDRLRSTLDDVLDVLRNEIGGLRGLTQRQLDVYVHGLLLHLLEQGGIFSPELPPAYLSRGGNEFAFTRVPHLPSYARQSRLPRFYTDSPQPGRFEFVMGTGGRATWQQQWFDQCCVAAGLSGDVGSSLRVLLPKLVSSQLLEQRPLDRGGSVWGLRADALRVSCAVRTLRCQRCGYTTAIPAHEASVWVGSPCLTAHCEGENALDEGDAPDYFGKLLRHGDVTRVVTEEHTGLLERQDRERVEQEFKAEAEARKPWFPNVLSCTPTLEMGIDIGDLSSAVLCSVPPAQANYLQRVGRAGRRDGNALVLTVASRTDHDLYFYAEPEEMLAGVVATPGVYLNAPAVLERQLAAFCLDRWVEQATTTEAVFPRKIDVVLRAVAEERLEVFPHAFLHFVQAQRAELEAGFLELFQKLSEGTEERLRNFLREGKTHEGSLGWRLLDSLQHQVKTRKRLREDANRITRLIRERQKSEVQDSSFAEEQEKLEEERAALRALRAQLDQRETLNVLTDEGLIPNYAFPETAVQLRSVIWRKRDQVEAGTGAYRTWSYEYGRPAARAIAEFAPENTFFAGGRKVMVDRVDLSVSEFEKWRFCDECSHSEREREGVASTCPACGSEGWADTGQVQTLLRLRQVFANTHDKKSRIGDESERRAPVFFSRRLLVSTRPEDRAGGWRVDSEAVPFAFEFLRKAEFREINFGEKTDKGVRVTIAGDVDTHQGFALCRSCGTVQPREEGQPQAHSRTCVSRDKQADKNLIECVYLYREFHSEAVRLLLPMTEWGSPEQLHSFVAALRMGLEDHFSGKVDHLKTTLDSEPIPEGILRRQFLVLYDTVPGGTGYLETLVSDPDALFSILDSALERLQTCRCASDPDADGCYRCLFAYRDGSQLAGTSRRAAIELLGRILEHRGSLTRVETLSDVAMTGLMDSVLEARFVEALRQSDTRERPVEVTKALVAGKPGFHLKVGGRKWAIEPQHQVHKEDGLGLDVSIDFVLRPIRPTKPTRSVAVFMDGWAYHRDRVGHDALQRMALLSSGEFEVWSFTWEDMEQVLVHKEHTVPRLAVHDPGKLGVFLKTYQLSALRPVLEGPSFEWFLQTLAGSGVSRTRCHQLSYVSLLSQLTPADEASHAAWEAEVAEGLPDVLADDLLGTGTDDFLASWNATSERPVSVFVRVSPAALTADKSKLSVGQGDGIRLFACLEDGGEGDLRWGWWAFLKLLNEMQFLPRIWFTTRRSLSSTDFARVSALRSPQVLPEAVPSEHANAWHEVKTETLSDFHRLVEELLEEDVAVPEVGVDLPSAKDSKRLSGAVAELAWSRCRIGVVGDHELEGVQPVSENWTLFSLSEALKNVSALVSALQGAGARRDG